MSDDKLTIAEGRKVLGAILAGKLVVTHNNHERYFGRDGARRVAWQMFATPDQQDIAAIVTAGAELSGLHVLHHAAIVAMGERLGFDSEAMRVELNAIDPFRWRREDGKLGREVK